MGVAEFSIYAMAWFRHLPTPALESLRMELIGLVFLQIALLFCAVIAGTACALIVYGYTSGMSRGRVVRLLVAFTFPVFVLVYLEAGILGYGFAERAVGEDNFLDGNYHIPLPNGYRLVIFDKMPQLAYIEQTSHPNRIGFGQVHALQIAGNALLVEAYQGRSATDFGIDEEANHYLVIDTNTSEVTEYPTREARRLYATRGSVSLRLTPVEKFLEQSESPGWRGLLFLVLLLFPVVVVTAWLVRKLRKLGQHLKDRQEPPLLG
jgi:hypothetical protein